MIFAFLRPGVAPTFESEDLLNLVESKFIENVSWESLNVPARVNLTHGASLYIQQKSTSEWNFTGHYIPQGLGALNIGFDIDLLNNRFRVFCTSGDDCTTIHPNSLSEGKNYTGVYLISMEKPTASEDKVFDIELICTSQHNCPTILGSEERFTGLNQAKIDLIESSFYPYDQIKSDWAFPQTKDFSIIVEDSTGIIWEIKPNNPIPEQVNVFTREILIPILEGDGSRKQIKTRISVW